MDNFDKMNRRQFLKSSLAGAGGLALAGLSAPSLLADARSQRPNILILFADDMTYHDLGIFGNEQVHTPNLDQLAHEGIRLNNTFNSSPMCAPTRMSLYTGIHPVRNGAYPNHSRVYPHIKSMPHYLQQLGYRSALIGKQHEAPRENFPFQVLGGHHHDSGKGTDIDLGIVRDFMEQHKSEPWSLVVASNQPHRPWNRGIEQPYDLQKLELPPYLVDTPETREYLARYYAEIKYMDHQMGQVLQHLEDTGQAENTIVVFLSEQGSNFPHCKWTCYDTGVRSVSLVRWPGVVSEGRVSDALVQYVDIVPTLLDAIGGKPSSHDFDGRSFLPLLQGTTDKHGDYAFSLQTSRGIYNGPEAYGIRSVRSPNYRYIWNLNHTNEFSNLVTKRFAPYKSWERKAEQGDPFARKRVRWYKKRPRYELYDLRKDPFELHNVAEERAYQQVRQELDDELTAWMKRQGDRGAKTEMKALERQSERWLN